MRSYFEPDYTTLRSVPLGEWVMVLSNSGAYFHIRGRDCLICLSLEPTNHHRGPWHATIEVLNEDRLTLDREDGWEHRYYFDRDRAKAEIEAWLKAWKQLEGTL